MWTILKTLSELMQELGRRLAVRRRALNFTQRAAAARSGVAYRTCRRMDSAGPASIEDLLKRWWRGDAKRG